jgi:hypothetical protein
VQALAARRRARSRGLGSRWPLRAGDLLRYGLWLGLLLTARANQRHFGLPTTWVIHLTGNSLALGLPEIYGALSQAARLDQRAEEVGETALALHRAIAGLVRDNPAYVGYVAPLVIGYLVSHPRFNIYRGSWGELRLAGVIGLDSIPHATTAGALTVLIDDAIATLDRQLPVASALRPPVRWAAARRRWVSAGALALLTAIYETSEWLIHNAELRATGGDASRINMEWSLPDALADVGANFAGWLAVVLLEQRQRRRCPADELMSR